MDTTFGDRVIAFNNALTLEGTTLPAGIRAMNPFREENAEMIAKITRQFYDKFYADNGQRGMILGINPGRLGAGLTGVPFSDTKRLNGECGFNITEIKSHEPSSVFVYEVIKAWGPVAEFYKHFYISSLCPLGFVITNAKGREVNYNYYDDKALEAAVEPFILETLQKQIAIGVRTDVVWCMGTGKNYKFFSKFNKKHKLFDEIVPLDHPRFVVQYRNKRMPEYVDKYVKALNRFL